MLHYSQPSFLWWNWFWLYWTVQLNFVLTCTENELALWRRMNVVRASYLLKVFIGQSWFWIWKVRSITEWNLATFWVGFCTMCIGFRGFFGGKMCNQLLEAAQGTSLRRSSRESGKASALYLLLHKKQQVSSVVFGEKPKKNEQLVLFLKWTSSDMSWVVFDNIFPRD